MIWTITPNPALDNTYRVSTLNVGIPHRVEDVSVRAGGKGVNVARVLAQLGHHTVATGFLGGAGGTRFRQLLSELPQSSRIDSQFVESDAETRLSIAVIEDNHEATVFNEAGQAPTDKCWQELLELLETGLRPGDVVACCGSLPGDSDPAWVGRIVETTQRAGARIIVDATGKTLQAACQAGADFVKPNDDELRDSTGCEDVAEGAQKLLASGVGAVIVSEGARGMSVHGRDGAWRAAPAQHVEGNPTGAGDASVAAWCLFLSENPQAQNAQELSAALPLAVSLSGAAVACPVAGEVDADLFAEMTPKVKVERY
ncbi:MAG: hexose kinase [Actinomycetaceae bacterium]|nr:hexose kinase [Actinomycetaceae bacterium]